MKGQPLILGVAAAVITIGIGVGTVLAITADDENAGGSAGPNTSHSRRSTTSSTSSSTRSSTTTKPGSSSTAAGSRTTAPPTTTTTAPDPPDPNDQYHPVPLPPGVSATISSCNWSPANGGELQASGTITNLSAEEDFWGVEVYWLVNNQGQDEDIESQYEIYDFAPGQTLPWNLSISFPLAPPNLSCALEVD